MFYGVPSRNFDDDLRVCHQTHSIARTSLFPFNVVRGRFIFKFQRKIIPIKRNEEKIEKYKKKKGKKCYTAEKKGRQFTTIVKSRKRTVTKPFPAPVDTTTQESRKSSSTRSRSNSTGHCCRRSFNDELNALLYSIFALFYTHIHINTYTALLTSRVISVYLLSHRLSSEFREF